MLVIIKGPEKKHLRPLEIIILFSLYQNYFTTNDIEALLRLVDSFAIKSGEWKAVVLAIEKLRELHSRRSTSIFT